MGKTYALRCFMNGLNPNQYQTASRFTFRITRLWKASSSHSRDCGLRIRPFVAMYLSSGLCPVHPG